MLEYRNTKLGVIEAKAEDEELTEGVAQANRHSGKLAIRIGTFATNEPGHLPHRHERGGRRAKMPRFPTPEELWKGVRAFAETNSLA